MSKESEKVLDDLRASRLHALSSTCPPHQMARLKVLQTALELGLARVAGSKLAPIVVERILESMLLHPETIIYMAGSSLAELPTTPGSWDAFAREQIRNEPLAVLCIESRDANRREVLRQTYISGLKPGDRMSQARAGTLDAAAESYVAAELQKSAGL
ncbi:MAG: hypothetical protein JWS10_632 [Cypionkella sp.]|nr:hypothetical protein [Cypionkella sp.]